MSDFMRVDDLHVYQKLCDLHLEVCELSRNWPADEKYELSSQARRSSNSSPAQLAEKHSDRHVRNKIEGVNRARGEALETVHHLYIASRKRYIDGEMYELYRSRYHEWFACQMDSSENSNCNLTQQRGDSRNHLDTRRPKLNEPAAEP
jgi:four helix bundle protein